MNRFCKQESEHSAVGDDRRRVVGGRRLAEGGQGVRGFSLIELLVVLAIIGILAAVSFPGLRGIGKSSSVDSAAQQLIDDLGLARARAINGRTTVHVIFVPPTIGLMSMAGWPSDAQKVGNQLLDAPYRGYRLFAARRVGDQPGRRTSYYMDEWKTLPEGVIVATNHMNERWTNAFETTAIPFPTSDAPKQVVPHLAFGPEGGLVDLNGNRLLEGKIVQLNLASILSQRDTGPNRNLLYYDIKELPPASGSGNPVQIRVDGFTGRASLVRLRIQ